MQQINNDLNRRNFLKITSQLGLAGVTLSFPGLETRAQPFIDGWQAVSTTWIANTSRNNQPLKLGLTDVINKRGDKGIRFAYQKPGQDWIKAVIQGSSIEALMVTEGQLIERSWISDHLPGWAGDFFTKAKDSLKKAIKKVVGVVQQVVEDSILALVKKFLAKSDGVLKDWITKVGDHSGLSTAATMLIAIVRTKGSPRDKLIAAVQAVVIAEVTDAAVEAIYAYASTAGPA